MKFFNLGENNRMKVIRQLKEHHVHQLLELYRNEWWSSERTEAGVRKMLANNQIDIGIVNDRDELIAYTRVLTDWVYKAFIFDVIVHPAYRGRRLGDLLIDTLAGDPELQQVSHIELYCKPEMVPFYERWGFRVVSGPEFLLMRMMEPEIETISAEE